MEDNNILFDHLNDELLERIEYNEDDIECKKGFVTWDEIAIVLEI